MLSRRIDFAVVPRFEKTEKNFTFENFGPLSLESAAHGSPICGGGFAFRVRNMVTTSPSKPIRPATAPIRPRLTAPIMYRAYELDHRYHLEKGGPPPPDRPPPPWLVYAGEQPDRMFRSASRDQFQRPPDFAIRRREACTPPTQTVFKDVDEPLPMTSHQSHFAALGVPRRRPAIYPSASKGLFSEVAELGTGFALPRSTSADHFTAKIKPKRRQPCRFYDNGAPFAGVDDPSTSIYRSAHCDHFQQRIVPRQRPLCKPSDGSGPPWAGVKQPAALYRTTSQDAFHQKPYAKRDSCVPPSDFGCPY